MGMDQQFVVMAGENKNYFDYTFVPYRECATFRKCYEIHDWIKENVKAIPKDDIDLNGIFVKVTFDELMALRKYLIEDSEMESFMLSYSLDEIAKTLYEYLKVPDGVVNIYYMADW